MLELLRTNWNFLREETMKKERKKGGGGKLSRSEAVTVRLDPKLKLAAELAARKQRRTLSAFIEWCVSEMVVEVIIDPDDSQTAFHAMSTIWHSQEADRFWMMATNYPYLMSYEESCLWDLIKEKQDIWDGDYEKRKIPVENINFEPSSPFYRKAYEVLKDCLGGKTIEESEIDQQSSEIPMGFIEEVLDAQRIIIEEEKKSGKKK
jgi:hypothetical protein